MKSAVALSARSLQLHHEIEFSRTASLQLSYHSRKVAVNARMSVRRRAQRDRRVSDSESSVVASVVDGHNSIFCERVPLIAARFRGIDGP